MFCALKVFPTAGILRSVVTQLKIVLLLNSMLAFCIVFLFLVGIYLVDIQISRHLERESDYVPILFALLLSCCFLVKSWYNRPSNIKPAASFDDTSEGKRDDNITSMSTSVLASFYHDASMMRKRSTNGATSVNWSGVKGGERERGSFYCFNKVTHCEVAGRSGVNIASLVYVLWSLSLVV